MSVISPFNIEFLRRSVRSGQPAKCPARSTSKSISRRSFLVLWGSAAAFTTIPGIVRGAPFAIAREGRRIHVLLGDEPRWTIDPTVFGSSASVRVDHPNSDVRLALRNAAFPGTTIPAD